MKYVTGDLFNSKDNLCHCVSADLKMGAGIAKHFKEKFGNVKDLKLQKPKIGHVLVLQETLEDDEKKIRYIFYLVTKEHYYDLPKLSDLDTTLKMLNNILNIYKETSISMPRIGCGLDKLNWKDVSTLIDLRLSTKLVTVYSLK